MSLFNFFKKTEEQTTPQKGTQNFYNHEQVKLPQNFAQTVMDLQMQMEFVESCDLQVVKQLNELYRIAIQYYATVDTKKAQHFHRKLTTLLTNPNTIEVIDKKKTPVKGGQDSNGYEKSLKQQLNKFNSQSNVVVKSMIEGNQKRIEHHNKLVNQHIETQESKLQRRLQQRSKSKSKKRDRQ